MKFTAKTLGLEFSTRDYVIIAVLAAAYFAAAKFGLSLAYATPQVTAVWPPTGIAFAAMFFLGRKYWPGIFVGAFLANAATNEPFVVAGGIAIGNTLEALTGAYLLHRFFDFNRALERSRDVLSFIVAACIIAPTVSASIGVLNLVGGGLIEAPTWGSVWVTWWVGDLMGALLIAPLLLTWSKPSSFVPFQTRPIEFFLLASSLLAFSVWVFIHPAGAENVVLSLKYTVFLWLIWAAFRFQQFGAVSSIMVIATVAVWGTIHNRGPFVFENNIEQNLLLLQLFLFVVATTALMMSAIVSERENEKAQDEAILFGIGDGLVVIDTEGRVRLVNRAFEQATGWKAQEAVGKLLVEVLPAQDESGHPIANLERPFSRAIQTGRGITTRVGKRPYYYVRRDRTRFPVAITVTPFRQHGKILGSINVFRDISREMDIDRAKSEFVSLASHQLRTPLTVIRWSAEMIHRYTGPVPKPQQKYVDAIGETSRQMVNLVDALLNVSRIEMGTLAVEPRPITVADLLDDVLRELKPLSANKKLTMKRKFDPKAGEIVIDPELIRVVVHNLITNAIKYTRPEGTVTVSLVRQSQELEISVADTGMGIPADVQSKVFTKLFRAENAQAIEPHGTGLGLYIAKAVVEQSGGKIWFESTEGQGTTFHFSLPLSGMIARAGTTELIMAK
jgi:PAS domain S-box-containing protein